MKKTILGLDLGTNSIGWALIEIDNKGIPIKIVAMGSRIIPLNSDQKNEFEKGQAISTNQNRTTARTQRKGYDRKQLRKKELKELFNQLDIKITDDLMQLPKMDLWKLRANAANPNEEISKEQLGRILFMFNQKRGYKSARSEANADKKQTDYVQEVLNRYDKIKNENKTIGEYFYSKLNDQNYRIKDQILPREAYISEFETIINIQKNKHPFLTENVINQLKNEIIFYQRNLKSQKGLINICELEGCETKVFDKIKEIEKISFIGPRVSPKTSPIFQICKIWEMVNNITFKVKNNDGSKYKWRDYDLSLEERKSIAKFLSVHHQITYKELIGLIGLNEKDVYPNRQISKGLQGNITYSEIDKIITDKSLLKFNLNIVSCNKSAELIDKQTGEVLDEIEAEEVDKNIEKEPLYKLWHTIYSIKDVEECKNALLKKFNTLNEIEAEQLAKIDFNKQAYGNKSTKAMRKILPYLMKGYGYSQACSLAGYNHSKSLTKDENKERFLDSKLELFAKNSLRQPVVEKILNQMVNVVNVIIDTYGKPFEIRVELARELKQSKDERNNTTSNNEANKAINKEIENRLAEHGIKATKRYIEKYKLIFPSRSVINIRSGKAELKKLKEATVCNQCLYCGQSFNLSEALTGDAFDVDHIVPKAILFDDSQTNKVLVHRKCNSDKLMTTAYDYVASKGEQALNEYLLRIDEWYKKGILGYGKVQRLKVSYIEYQERKAKKKETPADIQLWESFIDRQLRETAYIAKKAKETLLKICHNVHSTEGNVTAKLRKLWGWDDALMNLQLPKFRDLGQTEMIEWTSEHGKRLHKKEAIKGWTKRDDHRHHAIDALVISCTKQGFIQRINTLSNSDVKDEMNREINEAKIEYNEKLSLLDKYLIENKPKAFTTKYVEQETDKILVSFKAGKKVATSGVRKAKVNGKKQIVQKDIIVPRGALHEQSVYGKNKVVDKDKSIKYIFENTEKIINKDIKALVLKRIVEHGDIKTAIESLKKEPIYLDDDKKTTLEKADCWKEEVVLKYPLLSIKTNDVQYIIDEKVKKLVKERLEQHGGNEKIAYKEPLYFNLEKKIEIKTVRLFVKLDNVEPVKKDENGKEIGFVKPGNNHHIAIYKDKKENYIQHSCTFWHAIERKKYKLPIVINNTNQVWSTIGIKELPQTFLQKLPHDNLELAYSLQQNEMYILGLNKDDAEKALNENNHSLISKHLYLVWSVSENNYWFRHHLETKNSDLKKTEGAKESNRYYLFKSVGAFINIKPIKVRINHLGQISKIGE
ncbi:MAG: type II CRISPR RNA-guided endonuclease Cas9 [Bacteroidota bacterium]|nr:type II CRISPR RNA-guided endonuclease Cas9 [Bacteroidota bacterium]